MRRVLAAIAAIALGGACGSSGSAASPTTPQVPRAGGFDTVYGSYRTSSGDVLVVTRLGWFADLGTGTYRTLYAYGSGRYSFGPGFLRSLPVTAVLAFGSAGLSLRSSGRPTRATRVALRRTDVPVPAVGASLAATITEAPGPGPHPGIVIVHGSEPGERYYYDFWVGLYTSLGLTVLTYDKRGRGASSGTYPGEFAGPAALAIYADDASAALAFLSHWPGVDPGRVGYHGGSQGGWTVPLAMQRHGGAAFAVLVSAPAVTVGQQGLWSEGVAEAIVGADHSGYDPAAALASLNVPVLWVLGSNDRTVPTAISVDNLNALAKQNFTVQLVESGHALLLNPTGTELDDDRSPGLAPGVISGISRWMQGVAGV